jgi:UDP-sugar transporter A1/2/3
MFACLVEDTEEISRRGFFHGWNHWVVLVIFLQAGAGLVVALVVKFSDNIYKGFAGGISTVLTIVMDYVFFDDTDITKSFLLGTLIVLLSTSAFQSSQSRKESTGIQGVVAGGAVGSTAVNVSGNSILLVEAGLGTTRERLVSVDATTTPKVGPGSLGPSSGGGSPTHGGSIEGGSSKTNGKAPHLRWVQRLGVGN